MSVGKYHIRIVKPSANATTQISNNIGGHDHTAAIAMANFGIPLTGSMQWIQNGDRITPSLAAAKFLWCCRINKIPAMFSEVSKDFGISTKRVMQTMSEIDYVPALGAAEYVDRLSKQLCLDDFVRDTAIDSVSKSIGGSSPAIKACCAMIKAIKKHGLKIKTSDIASTLDVTTTGIQLALKRET